MKVTVFSARDFDRPVLKAASAGKHELIFTNEELTKKTVEKATGSDAVCLFTTDDASAPIVTALHKMGINYIALRSVGYDHVDIAACKELGIEVANVPEYSPYAVAEHAITLLQCLNRKIMLSQELINQNDFRVDRLAGFDLHGKTIGVIGTGKIGAAFAKIAHGFGCNLLAYDVIENEKLKAETNIKYVSIDALCHDADVISLHCPLNHNTKHLLNKDKFNKMKKGVYIINTARGGVINTEDLIAALDAGIVGAAGLDVYEFEKGLFFEDHTKDKINDKIFTKLQSFKNVLITGHQAFLTKEALQNIAATTIKNLDSWQSGVPCKNLVS